MENKLSFAKGAMSDSQGRRNLPRCRNRDNPTDYGYFFPFKKKPIIMLIFDGNFGFIESEQFIDEWEPTTVDGRIAWNAHVKKHYENFKI
jgi:hypothetical protein